MAVKLACQETTRSGLLSAATCSTYLRVAADDHMPCVIVPGRPAKSAKYGLQWIGLTSPETVLYAWLLAGVTNELGAAPEPSVYGCANGSGRPTDVPLRTRKSMTGLPRVGPSEMYSIVATGALAAASPGNSSAGRAEPSTSIDR